MNICIIFGSPRAKGNTAALLDVFIDEMKKKGHKTDIFNAYKSGVKGCTACRGCQKDIERICCVIDDDMQPIYKSAAAADLIVIASPIYAWTVPGPVKLIMDRFIYAGCKYYGGDPHGPSLYEGKRLALLAACGYPPEKAADLYIEQMKRYCAYTKMVFGGMLCERQRNLDDPFMDEEKAGHVREFAERLGRS